MKKIHKSIFKKLHQPKSRSKKGDNGILTIIGGSKKYHGAPIYSLIAASYFIDLVYFNSIPENNKLINGLKSKTAQFTAITDKQRKEYIDKSDAILIGPGLGIDARAQRAVNNLMKQYPGKKFILDADALKVVKFGFSKQFARNIVITPNKGEFKFLFKCDPIRENVEKMCKNYGINIVLKGEKDIVCSPWLCYYNNIGNPGMTKGGTGDVLAGIIAAFSCKNDLMLAAQAGTLLTGMAGNDLKKKYGLYFNATQLAEQLPLTLNKILKK
ncbi:NAD(P)H-hydrate dehydratase [Patescibacteria group bacterium]|nr:NAD(P)H-hydrate dehydratase [Patescibacteria group bacterium]MBU1673444.1 NAD(P)H-hydrate dehydratase [Patescibacteria group bacterium]MBU1963355.1 NAD(P)H-hydrate dehydratase [Patescibacteria group bacterium]